MTEDEKNPYTTLGIKKGASEDEIRTAYRKLARKFHPDVNPGDRSAEERFKTIASAYEVLSDKDKRSAYDEFGDDGLKTGFDPEQARAYNQWKDRRQESGRPFSNEYVNLEDLFGGGGFGGPTYGPQRGQDIYAVAELDLAQVVLGTEVSLQIPGNSKPTRIRIPAGAETGSQIRLRGRGGPGVAKGPRGDLVIETRVRPHPIVSRDGLNLTLALPITLSEAYKGAVVDVPTFAGSVKLTIPPQSQNGQKLRLRNKGISRKKKQGHMYVKLEVTMPDKASPEFSKRIEQSDALYSHPVRSDLRL